jgi:high affinity Mn2+ porin
VFDLSNVPAGGALSTSAYALDPTFSQLQFLAEIEERHEIWGQPGKLKITGFVSHGRAGDFLDALAIAAAKGIDPSLALALDRKFRDRPGVSLNLEQQATETIGVFARAGWADGRVEPWDFTDVDRSLEAGVSISGKQWGRPDDTFGFVGMLNGLDKAHAAYFAAGGMGILVGDGSLPKYSAEKIIEAYYNYALTSTIKLGADYQFIADPGYNATRGPANVFAGRVHWTF